MRGAHPAQNPSQSQSQKDECHSCFLDSFDIEVDGLIDFMGVSERFHRIHDVVLTGELRKLKLMGKHRSNRSCNEKPALTLISFECLSSIHPIIH
jgi:hypothetical protein